MESLLKIPACHDDTGEADKHRNTALEAITDTGGQWNGGAFDWASDSDSRLGPVLELVTGGVCYLATVFANTLAGIAATDAPDRFVVETH